MRKIAFPLIALSLAACDAPFEAPKLSEDAYREQAVQGMHDVLMRDVVAMREAVTELQEAAPTPSGRGWDARLDAGAMARMKEAWIRARTAYEHVEGALAPMFPDLDVSIDARYDDFLTTLGAKGDEDLFDDRGVTGMHAVERIVFSDTAPPRVATFERSLPGYAPAAFPATEGEASSFKQALCQKLVTDAKTLEEQWQPANIDAAIAFQGLILLVEEQREKVKKAASNEEESRYAERTMADLRDNLEGSEAVYLAFEPWISSKEGGVEIASRIALGFAALERAYGAVDGARIPEPPRTWSAEAPSPADLDTPFGRLYTAVDEAVDPGAPGSLAGELRRAGALLGLQDFSVRP